MFLTINKLIIDISQNLNKILILPKKLQRKRIILLFDSLFD